MFDVPCCILLLPMMLRLKSLAVQLKTVIFGESNNKVILQLWNVM